MGLDTPELPPHNKCASKKERGYAARDRLRSLLKDATVAFCPDGVDRYGRRLAVVLADDRDVAEVLIGEGLAREYQGGRRDGWCGE
jgi:endonuclease YncB( thermonuclease family)